MSGAFPKDHEQAGQIARRQRRGRLWQLTFQACTVIGIVALMALLAGIVVRAKGRSPVPPTSGGWRELEGPGLR